MSQRSVGALLRAVALVLVASVAVFAATALLPADAVAVRSGGRVDGEQLAQLRAAAGLDRPIVARYLDWLGGLLTGDPGSSLVSGRPVAELVGQRAPVSVVLVVGALVLAVPLAAALARTRGPAVGVLVVAGAALPPVVVGVGLAALLSGAWQLVPPVSLLPAGRPPWSRPELLVLPVLTLALPTAAYAGGQLRGTVADVVARPFVRDAVLRGMPPTAVALRYVGPLVAGPALRVLAVSAGSLVAGTTVVETLFGMSGLGELLVAAVRARDVPVVQVVALLAAVVVVAGLLFADLVATRNERDR
ncbi:MAG: ABC transporter permease [Pseudonocardia sp.]|nr:ABC transporter permease [Pseudonocardia sp.]